MAKQVHYRHLFHAAGHGTFFTGDIFPLAGGGKVSWVYDCGSRRVSQLRGLVEDYVATLGSGPRLQFLCLSHFDADHVNGLDELLSACRVRRLILPYAPLEVRLHLACDLDEDAIADAAALSALLVDPLAFVEQRGYGDKVGEIIFMHGGGEGDVEPLRASSIEDGPRADVDEELQAPRGSELVASAGYPLGENGLLARLCSHHVPWTLAGVYEWSFFNKQWPNQVAPVSGLSLDGVARDIRAIVDKYELCSKRSPRPGWLAALRKCYASHFGSSAKRRNEISLCVLGRPLANNAVRRCEIFKDEFHWQRIQTLCLEPQRPGVLLTGDFVLTAADVKAMRSHFGTRWDEVGVVQIPHHGSRHNWRVGVLDDCKRAHNVICAPGTTNHPHEDVTADLSTYLLADYDQGVEYVYHA